MYSRCRSTLGLVRLSLLEGDTALLGGLNGRLCLAFLVCTLCFSLCTFVLLLAYLNSEDFLVQPVNVCILGRGPNVFVTIIIIITIVSCVLV